MNHTRFYRTLCKASIKKEKKELFLIREEFRLRIKRGQRIYRENLEPPPKYNYRAGNHLIKEWFFRAEKYYLENHVRIRPWLTVKRSNLIKKMKILDYKWVYIYKFNKYSRVIKYKTHLIVRGDQQKCTSKGEMYIITFVRTCNGPRPGLYYYRPLAGTCRINLTV